MIDTVCIPIAGRGKRLLDVGEQLPKCMLRFNGKTLLDYAVANMKMSGIRQFIFVVGYLKDRVKQHIRAHYHSLDCTIVEQPEQKGLVDAVCCAQKHLKDKAFAIYCPDNFFADTYDLSRCLNHWTSELASCVNVRHVNEIRENIAQFKADFHENPGVAMIAQKIEPSRASGWVSTGFSVESQQFFKHANLVNERDNEKRLFDVWRSLHQDGQSVLAVPIEGKLFDISKKADIDQLKSAFETQGQGVAVILRTKDNQFLMMERDKKIGIRYPGYWALFGGNVEKGEDPLFAACRELKEELDLCVDPGKLTKVTQYESNLRTEHVFVTTLEQSLKDLILREGRQMALMNVDKLIKLKVRDDDKQAIFRYLKQERFV